MVSVIYTQSDLLQQEVYLVDRIENGNREKMSHLKCVCYVRPTPDNLRFLTEELSRPKYGEYHLCKFA